jgi:NAD(P)-dependent dehydrogenase (short-subunit alcohol dehydrogenase family)
MSNSTGVVLITGVSSGIGQATARYLTSAGYRVFGTSRIPERCPSVEGVHVIGLDVRDPASVEACVAGVLDQTGRIDVLINNAGYGLFGGIEEASDAEVHAQFETNYFGMVRLTKAVLPIMRDQHRGRIINISSIAGLLAVPFLGHYSASKFAVEGYTEALHHEVAPLGIHVSLIEPGVVFSPFWNLGLVRTQQTISEYDLRRSGIEFSISKSIERRSIAPETVARKIIRVLKAPRPALRYGVGTNAQLANHLKSILPARVLHAIWHRQMEQSGSESHFSSLPES